jgi:hypothetical protein
MGKKEVLHMWFLRVYFSAALTLMIFPSLLAQKTGGSSDSRSAAPYRTIDNNAFGVGEELVFDVNYGFITAGQAVMRIPQHSWQNGRKCYFVQFMVRSKPFFDTFYKVRDRYESHIDTEGLFPWKFVQSIREGGYKRDFSARFNHEKEKAYTTEGSYPIPPFVQDVVSAFYFMRTYDYGRMKKGQRVELQNFYKDSTYTLTVIYHGKEEVEVEAGTFRTIVLEPVMQEGGLFKATGRILVWLTDDERRMPVQVDAEIPIGSITSELVSYSGTKGPVRARIGD